MRVDSPMLFALLAALALAPGNLRAEMSGPDRAPGEARQVFEIVDSNGVRLYTSDEKATADVAESPADDDPTAPVDAAEDESQALELTLGQYLRAYGGPALANWDVELSLELHTGPTGPAATDREAFRRDVQRAELVATMDAGVKSRAAAAREALPALVFPLLRSVYPNAHLTVTLHDGVHTICRADWDPSQQEPEVRVK